MNDDLSWTGVIAEGLAVFLGYLFLFSFLSAH